MASGKRNVYLDKRKISLHFRDDTLFSFEGTRYPKKSGDDSKEDPPVPIPNTEVKLFNVDDTWWATAWESR